MVAPFEFRLRGEGLLGSPRVKGFSGECDQQAKGQGSQ